MKNVMTFDKATLVSGEGNANSRVSTQHRTQDSRQITPYVVGYWMKSVTFIYAWLPSTFPRTLLTAPEQPSHVIFTLNMWTWIEGKGGDS